VTARVDHGIREATTVPECREVLSEHAKSFRWAGAFLPSAKLNDASVVYALCRLIDDIADERTSDDVANNALAELESELLRRSDARPIVALFLEVAERTEIPVEAAIELIEGVRYDMHPVMVPDDRALLRYCYRVAGTVGLMMCGVIGVRSAAAYPFAVDLGVGMQLTNISRDVAEDAGRGRVYLPATRLAERDVAQRDLLEPPRAGAAPALRSLLANAEHYYESGDAGMRFIPWRARFAILVASRVYREIGTKIAQQQYDPDAGRARVSTGRKLWCTALAGLRFMTLLVQPAHPHRAELHVDLDGLPGTDPGRALAEPATESLAQPA
jgi:phytoene synthase